MRLDFMPFSMGTFLLDTCTLTEIKHTLNVRVSVLSGGARFTSYFESEMIGGATIALADLDKAEVQDILSAVEASYAVPSGVGASEVVALAVGLVGKEGMTLKECLDSCRLVRKK
jgi:galactokinase